MHDVLYTIKHVCYSIIVYLEIYFSGLGKVKFEIAGKNDIAEIGKIISEKIL